MSVYGEGECLLEIVEVCRLGDKGVIVDPVYCLACALMYLAEVVKEATNIFPKKEEEDETDESRLT